MRHYIHPQPRKERPPRFLPFKAGDKVVLCPHKTICSMRGRTGEVFLTISHLDVDVIFNETSSTRGHTKTIRAYELRLASECHDCCHRMTHLMGTYCPLDHKGIVFYEPEENIEDNEKDS
jgi:hypothetical protein